MKSKPTEGRMTGSRKAIFKKNKKPTKKGAKSVIGRESGNGTGRAKTDSSQWKNKGFFSLEERGTPRGVAAAKDANELS